MVATQAHQRIQLHPSYSTRCGGTMRRVGVIGTGAWGTTLAILLANKGFETTLWEHQAERADAMERDRENRDFLPDISFPFSLRVTARIHEAVADRELVLLVTPAQRLRENVRAI